MISQKERTEMIKEAARWICINNGESWGEHIGQAFTEDAEACLAIFEPILRAEIEADYKNVQDEMDRLIEENERLTELVDNLEADAMADRARTED